MLAAAARRNFGRPDLGPAGIVCLLLCLVASSPAVGLWDGWNYELEAEIELSSERSASESSTEMTFDEVGFVLGAELWQIESGIKYESDGSRLRIEEGALRVGGSDAIPWFVQVGRTGVPFGQLESNFVEDPLTVVVGEIDAGSAVIGIETDRLDAALSVFESEVASGGADFAASALVPWGAVGAIGAAWTSDLAEAVELRELREDQPGSPLASEQAIGAIAAFAGLHTEHFQGHVEWVGALRSFTPRSLGPKRLRPQALDLELSSRIARHWAAAARLEWSRELPENPSWQTGVALWFQRFEVARVGVDLLHAEGRQLFSLIVALHFGESGEE